MEALMDQAVALLFENAAESMIAVDTENRVLFCNAAARSLFGLDVVVVGRPLQEVTENPDLISLFASGDEDEEDRRQEIIRHDGDLILAAQLTVVPDVGRVAVMQDVTQLRKLSDAKGEFVQRISHDIRSPLTAILGYAELLGRIGELSEQQTSFVERINIGVRTITALITDLAELDRVEAKYQGNREATPLAQIVRYAIEGNRRRMEAKEQSIDIDIPGSVRPVMGNPLHLREMVHNLLDNAIKYTGTGGGVKVSLTEEGEFLVLQVTDTGIGIPPEAQPYVFDRFYRADNAVKTSAEGTGLGLSIVKTIVEAHAGRIWLESHVNQGTTFTVMLPVKNGQNEESPPQPSGVL